MEKYYNPKFVFQDSLNKGNSNLRMGGLIRGTLEVAFYAAYCGLDVFQTGTNVVIAMQTQMYIPAERDKHELSVRWSSFDNH